MTIIAHNRDYDGIIAAVLLLKKFPDATYLGMDYHSGDSDADLAKIPDGDTVYMADFSLEPFERMVKLNDIVNLIWLDHHISAITEYEKSGVKIDGVRDNKRSGCEITWQYLFPDQTMPEAIKLLGRYDVWDKTDPRVDVFQYGMGGSYALDPKLDWTKVLESDPAFIEQICKDGEKIQTYQNNANAAYAKACAFEIEFEGHKCIVINVYPKGHFIFEGVPNYKEYDIMLAFCWKKDKYGISLYTENNNVDCAAIVKKYGGGGHKKAAGFSIDTLPFKLPKSVQDKTDKANESIHSFEAWRKAINATDNETP